MLAEKRAPKASRSKLNITTLEVAVCLSHWEFCAAPVAPPASCAEMSAPSSSCQFKINRLTSESRMFSKRCFDVKWIVYLEDTPTRGYACACTCVHTYAYTVCMFYLLRSRDLSVNKYLIASGVPHNTISASVIG